MKRWSDNDYKDIAMIWKGNHPSDGQPLEVIEGTPAGGPVPELDELPEEFAPGISEGGFRTNLKTASQVSGTVRIVKKDEDTSSSFLFSLIIRMNGKTN